MLLLDPEVLLGQRRSGTGRISRPFWAHRSSGVERKLVCRDHIILKRRAFWSRRCPAPGRTARCLCPFRGGVNRHLVMIQAELWLIWRSRWRCGGDCWADGAAARRAGRVRPGGTGVAADRGGRRVWALAGSTTPGLLSQIIAACRPRTRVTPACQCTGAHHTRSSPERCSLS